MEELSKKSSRDNDLSCDNRDIIARLMKLVADISSRVASGVPGDIIVTQNADLGNDRIPCKVFATWKVLRY